MTTPPADLGPRIARLIAEQTGEAVEVHAVAPLPGGACQDLFRVDLAIGGATRRLVLRSDARSGLSGTLSRRQEFAVIGAAVAAGVRTPPARWLVRDLVREGAWAYFLDWAEGEALGARVVRSPELAAARPRLPGELAQELARIHGIGPETPLDLPRPGPDGPAAAELAAAEAMLAELRAPRPALELALSWLRANVPPLQEVTLLHGDFRTGNYLVTPTGLSALLDWEFSRFGSPLQDVAWFCLRDWRFGQLRLAAGGLCPRTVFYDAYEACSGRRVDPAAVRWFEVLGNVRWALGCVQQGERYLSGQEGDLELLAIGRRAVEMEWEALRLIDQQEQEQAQAMRGAAGAAPRPALPAGGA